MKKLTLLFLLCTSLAYGQVSDFSLKNVVSGNQVSLQTYPGCSGLLIVFTSNTCPMDEYYRARVKALAKKYNEKIPVILINSGSEATESEAEMLKKAQSAGIDLPYLADKDQKVFKALGATRTPQAFLLQNQGGTFRVVYSGAIDDNAQVETDVHTPYLLNAMELLVSGQPIAVPEVRPVGCLVRKLP